MSDLYLRLQNSLEPNENILASSLSLEESLDSDGLFETQNNLYSGGETSTYSFGGDKKSKDKKNNNKGILVLILYMTIVLSYIYKMKLYRTLKYDVPFLALVSSIFYDDKKYNTTFLKIVSLAICLIILQSPPYQILEESKKKKVEKLRMFMSVLVLLLLLLQVKQT